MPDEKAAVQATEAPEEELPVGDAPFKTTVKAPVEAEESTEQPEISEEAKELAKEEVPPDEKTGDEELDEVEELLKEPETDNEKSKVQRRIDQLTAKLKTLEEENAKIRMERDSKDGKPPVYTPQQLKTALKKAFDDGDADLAWDIIEYRNNQIKEELRNEYITEQNRQVEQTKKIQSEWDETVNAYAKYSDTKIPALWSNSQADLNLKDANSLLYQVALALYQDETKGYKKQPGGQKLAVADALTIIMSKKGGKRKDSEKELLKRQLLKEKRKKTIPGTGSSGEEELAPKRPLSDSERLAEVLAERKKYKGERIGGF